MALRTFHPKLEWLSSMLDGELGARKQKLCQTHLAQCPTCQNLWEGLNRLKAILKTLPPIEPKPMAPHQLPRFIPVMPSPIAPRLFLLGIILGALSAWVFIFRPTHPPMRVVSSPSTGGVEELQDGTLKQGTPFKALLPGHVDLEIPDRLLLRLQPGTTMSWHEVNQPGLFWVKPKIVLNVMQGEILARTQEGFWGRHLLEVHTPSASAIVKGTAFSVSVNLKKESETTLKVAAGSVFLSPYLKGIGVEVPSGHKSVLRANRYSPSRPSLLSVEERKALMATYRLGDKEPQIALVIGSGPERVKELLAPSLLYLSFKEHPDLHFFIRAIVKRLNTGILEGNLTAYEPTVRALEATLDGIRDPEIAVPMRLFAGACWVHLGKVEKGRVHFQWVVARQPNHALVPLALGALALTAEHPMRQMELAHAIYKQIAIQYPRSPEAVLAREFLKQRYPR
jgi:hypothetical protein